jgi:hypothetical protein
VTHEIPRLLAAAGTAPSAVLTEMLDEIPSHRTERRGCGYTQATRFLAEFINRPRTATDAGDLAIFEDWPAEPVETMARRLIDGGWKHGWRRMHRAPVGRLDGEDLVQATRLRALHEAIDNVTQQVQLPESRILMLLVREILDGATERTPVLPPMHDKPEIGSCSQAEEFFLELAHGKVRRGGNVNLVTDELGTPLMIEKMNLGESHSALLLSPVRLNDVMVPPGALFALRHADSAKRAHAGAHGLLLSTRDIGAARFLRLTTFAVAPEIRRRAFSSQIDTQLRHNLLSPLSTTLDHVRDFARGLQRRTA